MSEHEMRVLVSGDTLYRDLDGEGVLLDLNTGLYFGLDEVGNRMWQLLAELKYVDRVHRQLCDEYDADPDLLRGDLERLVDDLLARKLLQQDKEALPA